MVLGLEAHENAACRNIITFILGVEAPADTLMCLIRSHRIDRIFKVLVVVLKA